MWFTKVVFPAPRNPVTTVIGILDASASPILYQQRVSTAKSLGSAAAVEQWNCAREAGQRADCHQIQSEWTAIANKSVLAV
jgi:hypothetical protein